MEAKGTRTPKTALVLGWNVDEDEIRRPWCFPCRAEGCRCWAEHLGIACDWHYGILETVDQAALREAVRRRHPRGGLVRHHIEQLVVIRLDLRTGNITNTVEETWAAEFAEFEAQESEAARREPPKEANHRG